MEKRERESVGDIILQLYICNFRPSAEKQNVQCPELRLYRIPFDDNLVPISEWHFWIFVEDLLSLILAHISIMEHLLYLTISTRYYLHQIWFTWNIRIILRSSYDILSKHIFVLYEMQP